MRRCPDLVLVGVMAMFAASCTTLKPQVVHGYHDSDAPIGHAANEPLFQFQGSWVGTLRGYDAPFFQDGKADHKTFCIFIGPHGKADVFSWKNGEWSNFGNRSFGAFFWGPQAMITSVASGHDDDGVWVEGLTFTLVRYDLHTATAYWLRTVNNLDMPKTDRWHTFAYGYTGRMRRIEAGDKPTCGAPRLDRDNALDATR